MDELYASGAIVLPILAGMALEAAALLVLFRRSARGIPPASLLPYLAAGACLVGAVGTALRGTWWGWTGALMLAGGVFHVLDLRSRWQ